MENPNPENPAPEQPTASAPEPQPSAAPAWHDSIQDENLKAFIAGKGFKDAGEAAKALQDLEGKTQIPESADVYKLPVPEGHDPAFAMEAAKWMHQAGIPVAQAQALAQQWNQYQLAQQAQADQVRIQQGKADVAALKNEWGNQYDANVELGRRAVRSFGVDEGTLDRISQALGDAETLRLFQRIGSRLGEGSLVADPGGGASVQDGEKALTSLMFPSMGK